MNTFVETVCGIVRRIPIGKTMTYGEVARAAGKPRACRGVGAIMRANYDPAIPCHRVVCVCGRKLRRLQSWWHKTKKNFTYARKNSEPQHNELTTGVNIDGVMENENTIYVSDSKNGKGLFSGRLIKSGEKIIEFHGPKKRMQDLPNPYSAVDDHYVQTGYI